MVCYGFFLMLGTVGFRASLAFVRHIYKCAALPLISCDIPPWLRLTTAVPCRAIKSE